MSAYLSMTASFIWALIWDADIGYSINLSTPGAIGDGLPGLVLKPIFRNQLFEGLQSGCGCHMAQYKYDYYVDYVN